MKTKYKISSGTGQMLGATKYKTINKINKIQQQKLEQFKRRQNITHQELGKSWGQQNKN